ncbi:lasso RiPP family leader peptide-containing protein [Promicromonospora sp. NPDC060271]
METKPSDVPTDVETVTVEPPVVTDLGSLTRLTLGQGKNDTADMKKYYY